MMRFIIYIGINLLTIIQAECQSQNNEKNDKSQKGFIHFNLERNYDKNQAEAKMKANKQFDNLMESIKPLAFGKAGVDYPIYHTIPKTSFSCNNLSPGYYADKETRCQVFHMCFPSIYMKKQSFLCPNGSVFSQELLTCEWWTKADCGQKLEINYASEKDDQSNSESKTKVTLNSLNTTIILPSNKNKTINKFTKFSNNNYNLKLLQQINTNETKEQENSTFNSDNVKLILDNLFIEFKDNKVVLPSKIADIKIKRNDQNIKSNLTINNNSNTNTTLTKSVTINDTYTRTMYNNVINNYNRTLPLNYTNKFNQNNIYEESFQPSYRKNNLNSSNIRILPKEAHIHTESNNNNNDKLPYLKSIDVVNKENESESNENVTTDYGYLTESELHQDKYFIDRSLINREKSEEYIFDDYQETDNEHENITLTVNDSFQNYINALTSNLEHLNQSTNNTINNNDANNYNFLSQFGFNFFNSNNINEENSSTPKNNVSNILSLTNKSNIFLENQTIYNMGSYNFEYNKNNNTNLFNSTLLINNTNHTINNKNYPSSRTVSQQNRKPTDIMYEYLTNLPNLSAIISYSEEEETPITFTPTTMEIQYKTLIPGINFNSKKSEILKNEENYESQYTTIPSLLNMNYNKYIQLQNIKNQETNQTQNLKHESYADQNHTFPELFTINNYSNNNKSHNFNKNQDSYKDQNKTEINNLKHQKTFEEQHKIFSDLYNINYNDKVKSQTLNKNQEIYEDIEIIRNNSRGGSSGKGQTQQNFNLKELDDSSVEVNKPSRTLVHQIQITQKPVSYINKNNITRIQQNMNNNISFEVVKTMNTENPFRSASLYGTDLIASTSGTYRINNNTFLAALTVTDIYDINKLSDNKESLAQPQTQKIRTEPFILQQRNVTKLDLPLQIQNYNAKSAIQKPTKYEVTALYNTQPNVQYNMKQSDTPQSIIKTDIFPSLGFSLNTDQEIKEFNEAVKAGLLKEK
ncbi:uncharacterized protein LOC142321645 [Lycorma delicatula]|uniref:uncharacterized protein LOC142321645 n=1 Tax=Lycorma delicatula TaxID=130591 RepID=UPI003F50E86E